MDKKKNSKKNNKIKSLKLLSGWNSHPTIRLFIYAVLGFIMYVLLMGQVIPETYELKEGEKSPVRLESPIQVIDEWETNRLKTAASSSVEDSYTKDDNIVNDQINQLEELFNFILNIYEQTELSLEEKSSMLIEFEDLSFLSQDSKTVLLNLTVDKVKNLKYISKTTLNIVLNKNIKTSEIEGSYTEVNNLIQLNPFDNDEKITKLASEITNNFVKPNYFYNSNQTLILRQEAKNKVEPVIIKKNELIVDEGTFIDKHTYEKLKAVGLLKENSTLWPYFGLLLVVSLLLLLLYYSIERMKAVIHQDNKSLLMLFIILLLTFVSIAFISYLDKNATTSSMGYIAPVAFGVLLISLLISMKFAVLNGIILSIFASMIFNTDQTLIFDFRFGFVLFIGSTAGAFTIDKIKHRSSILKAGLIVALFNVLAILVIIMLSSQSYSLLQGSFAILNGLIGGFFSAVLTIGLLPFFESVFGILSPIRLIELSNPNHPLLRKLLIETPGTYHHSIIVGNLAEAAAEAIEADGLLARVGAYYHDLGKTKRPTFFIENQLNMENPHDKISPSLSRNIILAHPKDGVEMLREYKLPVPIQDIAMQHHGTSLLKFFYHKASKESNVPISENDFRYPGPNPQTKEAAIVGISDSVEAAVRSINLPTNEIIEETVRKIIKSKLNDGQLNECDLTLKELEIIAVSILETLKGIFHSRIVYPDDKEIDNYKGAKSS